MGRVFFIRSRKKMEVNESFLPHDWRNPKIKIKDYAYCFIKPHSFKKHSSDWIKIFEFDYPTFFSDWEIPDPSYSFNKALSLNAMMQRWEEKNLVIKTCYEKYLPVRVEILNQIKGLKNEKKERTYP